MARNGPDQKPVKLEQSKERTERTDREVDLFKSMEEDMVFGGEGRGVDLRPSSSSYDDDRDRW